MNTMFAMHLMRERGIMNKNNQAENRSQDGITAIFRGKGWDAVAS